MMLPFRISLPMLPMLIVLAWVTAGVAAEEIQIDVVGLFKDAAILEVNGERRVLKEGERSKEGIVLISADSKAAVIELEGRRIDLTLTSQIGTQFKPPKHTIVTIGTDELGQYRTVGSINGRPVSFLVDTGANIIALNSVHARSLGLNYEQGRRTRATTAGGMVDSWTVTLDSVQVGDIRVRNVRAAVLRGDFPQEILLGMSFLSNVEINESAGVLILKGKL
jgi:aspartyl protease family protein